MKNEASAKTLDGRLRRVAVRAGMRARKSRQAYHSNNRGGYMLVDAYSNTIAWGVDFELSVKQALEICRDRLASMA